MKSLIILFENCYHKSIFKESAKNPFEVKPNYRYWAPYIGPAARADIVYNTEHRKCRITFSPEKDGINAENLTVDHLMEVFSEGKASTLYKSFRRPSFQLLF